MSMFLPICIWLLAIVYSSERLQDTIYEILRPFIEIIGYYTKD